jgi:hypothetical protein
LRVPFIEPLWQIVRTRACAPGLAAAIFAAVMLAFAGFARADNLLLNGDFSEGTGDQPAHWQPQNWIDLPSAKFTWIKPSGGEPGMVSIDNTAQNDTRWVQPLHLAPGWYYLGAQIETIDVGRNPTRSGALVGLIELGVTSDDLKGSNDWQNEAVYLKVGPGGADVQFALRLSGFGGFNAGQALFRGASVVPIDAPPTEGDNVIELDTVRDHFGAGSRWSMLLLIAPLLASAAAGWMILRPPNRAPGSSVA